MERDCLSKGSDVSKNVEILDKRAVFKGYFRVDSYRLRHSLFDGGWSLPMEREIFERGHAAAVLPYDPAAHPAVLGSQAVQLAGDKIAKDAKMAEGLGAEGTIKTSAQGLGAPSTAKSTLLGG